MESITAQPRSILGKATKNLRKDGFLPAVIYGQGKKAEPISIPFIEFKKIWKAAGKSSIISLKLKEKEKNVLIHDVSYDALHDTPLHVDFYTVDMTHTLHVSVPIEFIGESSGVKSGGILVKVMHSLNVEAMPKDLPHSLHIDIVGLKLVGDSLFVKDVVVPRDVKVLDGSHEVIALLEEPRVESKTKEEAPTPSLEDIEVVGKKTKKEEESEASEGKEKTEQ